MAHPPLLTGRPGRHRAASRGYVPAVPSPLVSRCSPIQPLTPSVSVCVFRPQVSFAIDGPCQVVDSAFATACVCIRYTLGFLMCFSSLERSHRQTAIGWEHPRLVGAAAAPGVSLFGFVFCAPAECIDHQSRAPPHQHHGLLDHITSACNPTMIQEASQHPRVPSPAVQRRRRHTLAGL